MNSKPQVDTIAELDLDAIKMKLMHKESGEGWSAAQADAAEFEYRRFLTLMKLFPHEQVSPLFEVDIFWHYHILDTMKYAADCDHIFGYFLHHFPYSGLLGAEDEAHRSRTGDRMQELYEATFGEDYIRAEHAVLAWLPVAPQIVFRSSTPGDRATLHSGKAKTAWSYPTINTAKSQEGNTRTASGLLTINTAKSQGHTAKTSWSYPTINLTTSHEDTSRTASRFATINAANRQGHTAKIAWSYPAIKTGKSQGHMARTA
jgi:hypothetical protein